MHRRPVKLARLILGFPVLLCAGVTQPAGAQGLPPNIVFVLLDDLGYGDLGSYGGTFIQTPEVDQLAAEGLRFTHAYSSAPTCSGSRVALLTGRHPTEFGFRQALRGFSRRGIPPDATTVAHVLRQAGYATGHFGKWHVGDDRPEFLPGAKGFDRSAIIWSGGTSYYRDRNFRIDDQTIQQFPGHTSEVITDLALDFIDAHRSAGPFFANVWYNAPHRPIDPPQEWADQYPDTPDGKYAALVAHADAEIGRLMDALDQWGIANDTLVVVTSDNGAWNSGIDSNGGLRGQKTLVFEGGIRVPTIVRWPGRVAPGVVNPSVVNGFDWLPTLAALAAVGTNHLQLAGNDVSAAIVANAEVVRNEPIFWETKRSNAFLPATPQLDRFAVLQDPWKHVWESGPLLYDLGADPAETVDLAAAQPGLVDALHLAYRDQRRRAGVFPHAVAVVEGNVVIAGDRWTFGDGTVVLVPDTRFDFHDGDFSLTTRILLDAIGGVDQVVAEHPGSWRLWIDAGGTVRLRVQGEDPAEQTSLVSTAPLTIGSLHEIAFTIFGWIDSPSTARLYVDGALEAETNEVERVAVVAEPPVVGNGALRDAPLRGRLEGLELALTSWTADEVLDRDWDGVANLADNCPALRTATQLDADGDGIGNGCDGDFDQDGVVDADDSTVFLACLGQTPGPGAGPANDPSCAESDMNGDGVVDEADEALFIDTITPRPPGPRKRACGAGSGPTGVLLALLLWKRCSGRADRSRPAMA